MFNGLHYAKSLTPQPGVYRMYDAHQKLLYVGKAKNLQKRVQSYFQKQHHEKRIKKLVSEIHAIEVTTLPSELDALLLESQLIKQLQPKYNILLRNDKGYPYLAINLKDAYPKFYIHQGQKNPKTDYAGPYVSKKVLHHHLEWAQRLFKLRTCDDHYFKHRRRPCLEYQIGRCSAPCVNYINAPEYQKQAEQALHAIKGNNKAILESLKMRMSEASSALDFEKAALYRDQIQELQSSFQPSHVEHGQETFDLISCHFDKNLAIIVILHISHGKILDTKHETIFVDWMETDHPLELYFAQSMIQSNIPWAASIVIDLPFERLDLLQKALPLWRPNTLLSSATTPFEKQTLSIAQNTAKEHWQQSMQQFLFDEQRWAQLQTFLNPHISPDYHPIETIECIDISHTQGTNTVASCVSINQNGPIKSRYRRYLIEGITPGDDYAAIQQAVEKRMKSSLSLPDVLLIDGGKNQLKRAHDALKSTLKPDIALLLIGISKGPERKAGEEEIHFLNAEPLKPGPHSHALQVMQRARDEAHRFAIEGQRKKQNKTMNQSVLQTIPGLGKKKRISLLTELGGWQGVQRANLLQLANIKGIGHNMATLIYEAIHGSMPQL